MADVSTPLARWLSYRGQAVIGLLREGYARVETAMCLAAPPLSKGGALLRLMISAMGMETTRVADEYSLAIRMPEVKRFYFSELVV